MKLLRRSFSGLLMGAVCLSLTSLRAQTNFSIYSDQLDNGFQNWSWGANNFSSTSPVRAGTNAIQFSGTSWEAISFWHATFNPAPYTNLTFWIHGGTTGGQIVQIYWEYGTSSSAAYQLPPLPTNSWRQFNLPLSALGVGTITNLNRLNFQLTTFGQSGAFSLDDVNLIATTPASVRVTINASQPLRSADARWLGLNTAVWDSNFDTPTTDRALKDLGTSLLRFPGGSLSDEYHWATGKSGTNSWVWGTTFNNFVHLATNNGVQAMITVNYGTGTPQEAAAWVRHANVTNRYAFKYWEVGNENYGTWETDTNVFPHDAFTYATRAAQFITQMKAADPTIKIGVPVVTGENTSVNGYTNHPIYNARTGSTNYGWTPVVLATLKNLGVAPDFLVHHVYPQYLNDNDQTLLQASANWAIDAADLRQQITDYFGTGGTGIELLCTENNADAGTQGRQSTSLVNGLYLADSLAQLMKTEFNSFVWWDLRNGQDNQGAGGDFNSSLYGWRTYGDLGIIGGLNTFYPTFYTFKLMQYLAQPGDSVLNAASDYFLLSSYATRKTNGALALLVINKDRTTSLNAQITLTNFLPFSTALARSYGIAQDEATRTNSVSPGAQDIATNLITGISTNFPATFPPYSLTLLTFAPAAPKVETLPGAGNFIFRLNGQVGVPYQIQTSTNLVDWVSNSTVRLTNTVWSVTNPLVGPRKFWRAAWLP